MNSITQDMRFRLSVVLSYYRVGATKTAIRYKVTRQFVYFWVILSIYILPKGVTLRLAVLLGSSLS